MRLRGPPPASTPWVPEIDYKSDKESWHILATMPDYDSMTRANPAVLNMIFHRHAPFGEHMKYPARTISIQFPVDEAFMVARHLVALAGEHQAKRAYVRYVIGGTGTDRHTVSFVCSETMRTARVYVVTVGVDHDNERPYVELTPENALLLAEKVIDTIGMAQTYTTRIQERSNPT